MALFDPSKLVGGLDDLRVIFPDGFIFDQSLVLLCRNLEILIDAAIPKLDLKDLILRIIPDGPNA